MREIQSPRATLLDWCTKRTHTNVAKYADKLFVFHRFTFYSCSFYRLSPVCFLFLYLSWQSFLQIALVSEHGGRLTFAACVTHSHEQKWKTGFCFFWHPYMFTTEIKESTRMIDLNLVSWFFRTLTLANCIGFKTLSSHNFECVTNAVPCSEMKFSVD